VTPQTMCGVHEKRHLESKNHEFVPQEGEKNTPSRRNMRKGNPSRAPHGKEGSGDGAKKEGAPLGTVNASVLLSSEEKGESRNKKRKKEWHEKEPAGKGRETTRCAGESRQERKKHTRLSRGKIRRVSKGRIGGLGTKNNDMWKAL